MPKIVSTDACTAFHQRLARESASRFLDTVTCPVSKLTTLTQLRPRIAQQDANVAYYNVFLSQNPTVEYDDGTWKMLSLVHLGMGYESHLRFLELICVDASSSYPVRGIYKVRKDRFLNTVAYADCDHWVHPDYFADPTNSQPFPGGRRIDNFSREIVLNKVNTICCITDLPESTLQLLWQGITETFAPGIYVYKTTENGTILLNSSSEINVSEIWGADDIYRQRFISVSKTNLLP